MRHRYALLSALGLAAVVVAGTAWLADAKPKKPVPAADTPPATPAAAQPATPPAAQPAPATPAAADQPPAAPPDIAARLKENGAGTCAPQVDGLAAGTMGNVAQFNTVSHWASAAVDKRLVDVSIGQKYPAGSGVPYGATTVVAAPNGQGTCDAVAVQVLPSPLPCDKIHEAMSTHGKQIADLAGIPLMDDAAGQTMLVATAANTCVLVAVRTSYAK